MKPASLSAVAIAGIVLGGLIGSAVLDGMENRSRARAVANIVPEEDVVPLASFTLETPEKIESPLPAVGSFDRFVALMRALQQQMMREKIRKAPAAAIAIEDSALSGAAASSSAPPAAADFSTTNVQVQGVDEADRIKTDGTYIYQLKPDKLVISRAVPADDMSVVWVQSLAGELIPRDMYVDERTLTVIGSDPEHRDTTKIYVYDLTADRTAMKLSRESVVDGEYVSSRKIGAFVYVVSNLYIPDPWRAGERGVSEDAFAPSYRDSADPGGTKRIPWEVIRYVPGFREPAYLLVSGIHTADAAEKMSVAAFLGASETIYASPEHLYVTHTQFAADGDKRTAIYKFRLEAGNASFVSEGTVDGALLNQFSLDEHNGYLRVATTTGDVRGIGDRQSKNHLFVLDESLKPAGELRDIAPGERIYSVRFMGDRGYMVTFKKVDPLFVFDLTDPASPKMLGKLKIPGYSDYLHPYDDHHLLGFGKDTVEAYDGDFAYYQGMKMALFDITDVEHPREKFVEIIGDRGTDSELLSNHKALLFSKEKSLIAFPVTVAEIPAGTANPTGNVTGEPVFQGLYAYELDLQAGFRLRHRITHLSDDDLLKMGHQFDEAKAVQRGLYIGNTLYTVSDFKIQAHSLETFEMKGELYIP